ncbi:MAG: hypothetical protein DWI59_05480 [Chloroflexi bacterium]|nr:MAG: hypothetical protein DWI59_05480 [Chloroflexota bacterium]
MSKTIPQPDEVSKPFWDAVDQKKLTLQYCSACDRLQYPVRPTCYDCGKSDTLTWREVAGKGHVLETMVVHDTRVVRRKVDVPFNVALISLDEAPYINFLSNLPGTPAHQGPQGAAVELFFEELEGSGGRFIHEWRVVGQ